MSFSIFCFVKSLLITLFKAVCSFSLLFVFFFSSTYSLQVTNGTAAQAAGSGHEYIQQVGPDRNMCTGTRVVSVCAPGRLTTSSDTGYDSSFKIPQLASEIAAAVNAGKVAILDMYTKD